ncbi:hypothetical protein MHYP_G00077740 [Metynnis hypsauchen]
MKSAALYQYNHHHCRQRNTAHNSEEVLTTNTETSSANSGRLHPACCVLVVSGLGGQWCVGVPHGGPCHVGSFPSGDGSTGRAALRSQGWRRRESV